MRKRCCFILPVLLMVMLFECAAETDYRSYRDALNIPCGGETELSFDDAVLSPEVIFSEDGIVIPETGSVELRVSAVRDSAYELELTYTSLENKRDDIEFYVLLNGDLPFEEAGQLRLNRIWKSSGAISQNNQGDDIVPEQIQSYESRSVRLSDSDGRYEDPFVFVIPEGESTLTLVFERAGLKLTRVRLLPVKQVPSYEEYLTSLGDARTVEGSRKYEAELTYRTSSPVLAPIYDKSSAATTPSSSSNLRLNTIGSNNWEDTGMWVSWEIEAPEDGLYDIAFRYRQNLSEGFFSGRCMTIDGEVPFSELKDIHFEYDDDWQVLRVPYHIYLTRGTHILKLEATTGCMAQYIKELWDRIEQLNTLYRRIIMITGTTPDIFRDYNLENTIPGMVDTLSESAQVLYKLADDIEGLSDGNNSEASYLRSVAYQLDDIASRPETMKDRLDTFKSNLSALATWMLELKDQPLELDSFWLLGTEEETPRADAAFLDELMYETGAFVSSFVRDYSNLGNVYEEGTTLRVWIVGGRDQAQVAKNLIDNRFVSKYGINVNLELVQGGLTEAILSGNAPDVIMNLGRSDPVNLGLRGALMDLSEFDDYEQTASRFSADANTPYRYGDSAYALPVTQSFCMMFCRTDIFEELGLEIPETWDEFFRIVRILQRKNLQVGVPVPSGTTLGGYDLFTAFLYQNGGSILNEDGTSAELDTPQAISAFERWTGLFTDMGLPLSYDFYSRFRTGEMPLAIQYYTQYNLLMTSAPDLTNLWKMAPLPGTPREDGTIDRSIMASGTACGISSSCKDKQAAWEFLKWWTGAQAQYEYGTNLETIMGAAVRYDTANTEALEMLPWSKEEYGALSEQMGYLREIPETPANYFIYRSITNAFRKVVYNSNVNPREAIVDYNLQMNKEIARKTAEFGS